MGLARSEFEGAVKDALRRSTQADLLAGNLLLRARLLSRNGEETASPQSLRRLLIEGATNLFAAEKDRRLYRVLDLTYFNPVPKQEVAAERLGLSFSTYRRHLSVATARLIEWLWQNEQLAQLADNTGGKGAGTIVAIEAPALRAARPRLSIVVLPFLNLSGEPNVDYLVDGIVDSLITDLSGCLPDSFVISRSTAFAYKGRAVPLRQLGEELGVRYVLEGSVVVDADWIRVNAQLIDAETDHHLWAERFDKRRKEILLVQDEIVGRLSRSVGIELVRSEAARIAEGPEKAEAADLVMRGRAFANDVRRRENAAEAVRLFHKALELDPSSVDAMVGAALVRIYQVINLYRLVGREVFLADAEDMIARAAALAPNHQAMLKARALLLRARGRFLEAIVAIEAMIARNPAEPTAYKEMGLNKLYLGQTREAIGWFRRADAIAPRDPERWTWLQGLGRALIQIGDVAGAVSVLSQALDSNPDYLRGKAMLAAAEALSGNIRAARRYLAEYHALEPAMTIGRFEAQRSSVPPRAVSVTYRKESQRILDGLRRAGMRE